MTIDDNDIIGLLHEAFVPGSEHQAAKETLLGTIGHIGSSVTDDILMLGDHSDESQQNFYAIPLSLKRLRDGIASMMPGAKTLEKPDETSPAMWNAMTDAEKALHVSEEMRPSGISPARWNSWSWRERAAQGMHLQAEEWDSRGAMSDMKPAGIEFEDLAILARIMNKLPRYEVERLIKVGYEAGGPDMTKHKKA